jgi:hypothetical protein
MIQCWVKYEPDFYREILSAAWFCGYGSHKKQSYLKIFKGRLQKLQKKIVDGGEFCFPNGSSCVCKQGGSNGKEKNDQKGDKKEDHQEKVVPSG